MTGTMRGGQEQMWAMEDTPRLFGEAEGWLPYSLWGMGIALRDLTGDGFPEVYLTSMGDQKFQSFDPEPGGRSGATPPMSWVPRTGPMRSVMGGPQPAGTPPLAM